MLRKLITTLAGFSIMAGAASSVVSCTAPEMADGQDGQRVVLVTNGGVVQDHSFNENAYKGVKDFLHDAYGNGAKNSYVESQSFTTAAMISGYRLALVKGANLIVAPGFAHIDPINASEGFLKNTNIVLLDSSINQPNVVSITYNSQIAGFMAGFNTSIWATTKNKDGSLQGDVSGDGKITIGGFMGAQNKGSVDNYVWGLLLGMQVYNEMANDWNTNPKHESEQRALVYTGNDDSGNISDIRSTGSADQNFYTFSFNLGDALKSGMVSKLVDTRNSDIVFPVAGSQIQDVLGYTPRWNNGKKPYVIGVDTDATQSLPIDAAQGRFVTSAIKDLDDAVSAAAYRAQSKTRPNTLKFDANHPNPYANDYWLGTNPDPLVNWSVALTNQDLKNEGIQNPQYKIDHSFIKLFDPENTNESAQKGMAMWDINNDYNNKTGQSPQEYMNGEVIVQFAKELVQKYGDINFDSSNILDWTKTK